MSTNDFSPCLLVAAPSLECPFFGRSVVLLVEHGDEGSLGFVVNRPSDMDFQDVASQLSLPRRPDGRAPASVLMGGPVQPESGWLLLDGKPAPAVDDGLIDLPQGLSLSASIQTLERLARGDGPDRSLLFLGYAGWGPGQLGDEFRDGSWIPADLDARLLFDLPLEERWTAALGSLGVDPGRVALGHEPAMA